MASNYTSQKISRSTQVTSFYAPERQRQEKIVLTSLPKAFRTTPVDVVQHQPQDDHRQFCDTSTLPIMQDQHHRSAPRKLSVRRRHSKASFSSSNGRKRKGAVESPSRTLSRQLMKKIAQLRESNTFLQNDIKSLQDERLHEIIRFQNENEEVNRDQVQLMNELDKWKRRCYELRDQNTPYLKLKSTIKENRELTEDLEICKSVVWRLNAELTSYQEKMGLHSEDIEYLKSRAETIRGQQHQQFPELKNFSALLRAYDEVIKEKNAVVEEHEATLNSFKVEFKKVVKENEELHELISRKNDEGTVSVEEWHYLHSNSLKVLEENDILREKLQLVRRREDEAAKSYEMNVKNFEEKQHTLEEETEVLKKAFKKAESHCQILIHQQTRLSEILEKRVPQDQHERAIQELKAHHQEQKRNLESENLSLRGQAQSIEKERQALVSSVRELESTNSRLKSKLKSCEDTISSNASKFKETYNKLLEEKKGKEAASAVTKETTKVSQIIAKERDNAIRQFMEQKEANEALVHLQERHLKLVSDLQHKIREMENVHLNEAEKFDNERKQLERETELQLLDQQDKVIGLERLSEEKSKRIEFLESENRHLQQNFKTMWKTATDSLSRHEGGGGEHNNN